MNNTDFEIQSSIEVDCLTSHVSQIPKRIPLIRSKSVLKC